MLGQDVFSATLTGLDPERVTKPVTIELRSSHLHQDVHIVVVTGTGVRHVPYQDGLDLLRRIVWRL